MERIGWSGDEKHLRVRKASELLSKYALHVVAIPSSCAMHLSSLSMVHPSPATFLPLGSKLVAYECARQSLLSIGFHSPEHGHHLAPCPLSLYCCSRPLRYPCPCGAGPLRGQQALPAGHRLQVTVSEVSSRVTQLPLELPLASCRSHVRRPPTRPPSSSCWASGSPSGRRTA